MVRRLLRRVCVLCMVGALLTACQAPHATSTGTADAPDKTLHGKTITKGTRASDVQPLTTSSPLFTPPAAVVAEAAALSPAGMGLSSWMDLAGVLQGSLEYVEQWDPAGRAVEHSGRLITWGEVAASLRRLQELLPGLDADQSPLTREFQWIGITPNVRFTGYFTPILQASPVRAPGFEAPIYRLPEELAQDLAWCLPAHSCPDTAFTSKVIRPDTPFLSRAIIDLDGGLAGRGLEMAWLRHPLDTYELMLEGSGMLVFPDGTRRMAQFAGLNGNRGQSLLGYLLRQGHLPRNKASIENAADWWDKNPGKRRALLEAASSYVFFRYNQNNLPLGTIGTGLLPWASMAVDPSVLPLGGILVYNLPRQPVPGGVRNGLGFAQDTGGAIRMRRVDMYTGEGSAGYTQAMHISTPGRVWLLLLRQS